MTGRDRQRKREREVIVTLSVNKRIKKNVWKKKTNLPNIKTRERERVFGIILKYSFIF